MLYRKTGNLRACQLLLDTRSSKAPFAISASNWMTRWSFPRGSKSNEQLKAR